MAAVGVMKKGMSMSLFSSPGHIVVAGQSGEVVYQPAMPAGFLYSKSACKTSALCVKRDGR